MDETLELTRLGGRCVAALMSQAPGLHVRLTRNSSLLLSGEQAGDLNMMFVGPGDDAERFLEEAKEVLDARGLPVIAFFTPHVAPALAPVAARLGFQAAGTLPLMVLHKGTQWRAGGTCEIEQVLDASAFATVAEMLATAFAMPQGSVARAFDITKALHAGADIFIGSRDGVPMSTVSVTRIGATAGIWSMATPAEHRRKGVGKALLTGVVERYRGEGVERFFLIATPEGGPLYENIGFKAVADYAAWTIGHSAQTAH